MERIESTYRQRRIALGLTQSEAAKAAGISIRTLRNFENGRADIRLGHLQRILGSVGLELLLREASARPTLDELSHEYRSDEASAPVRQRARKKTRD